MNSKKQAKRLGKKIRKAFRLYGVEIRIVGIQFIANLKRYIIDSAIELGTEVKKVLGHSADVQAALGFPFFRAFKEGNLIRFAVSEYDIKQNNLLAILRSKAFSETDALVPYAVGFDLFGNAHIADLVKSVHMLIAGPTRSGKSTALKCLVLSAIVKCPVSFANVIIFDIGGGSFSEFDSIPHLSHPIIKDINTGIRVLEALYAEMEDRISTLEKGQGLEERSYLLVILDEFNSMIDNATQESSEALIRLINNLLRRGGKAKIIMILANHDTSSKAKVDLSQITSRISFQWTNHHKSSSALGITGAEKLIGKGAMIYTTFGDVHHLQGANVTDEEIKSILSNPPTDFDDSHKFLIELSEEDVVKQSIEEVFCRKAAEKADTSELARAIVWALGLDTASSRQVQKTFHVGQPRADAILDRLYQLGIVEKQFSKQPRKVLIKEIVDLSPEALSILTANGVSVNTDNQPNNKMNQTPKEVG